ncbi:MAG: hypothetical protein E7632_14020 [Ruminococcaceae bacterium]|nr:hypothetical protein [Oscillospiraceae bacterium]
MANLKTGFARIDITPPLGTTLAGYFNVRHADGILDPLYATAVAFDDGQKRIVVMSLDLIGFNMKMMDDVRPRVAKAAETATEAVFIACTHTHLGPCTANAGGSRENDEYIEYLTRKLCDTAYLAVADLAPTEMSYTRGKVEDVAFIRRYRMKDGTGRTNPGRLNPDILHPIGEPDENSSLLILKREGKPEIGIVNFQVHPDVIGGTKISADYPKFVRDTYEALIPNSRCMYINGAQGDTNHIDVRLGADQCRHGYERSRYMGRRIAMSVLERYELATPLADGAVNFGEKYITTLFNKGLPEEIPMALEIYKVYTEQGNDAAKEFISKFETVGGMKITAVLAKACRIARLMDAPDEKVLRLTAVSVGDVALAGFPGEPFTDIGRQVKENSKFELTLTACCANGYEGYYPMQSAYDEGGYEASTARYVAGTAEKIIENSTELVNSL